MELLDIKSIFKLCWSNKFIILYVFILVFNCLFKGKISGYKVEKRIQRILKNEFIEKLQKSLDSESKVIDELRIELYEKINLKEILTEYYNYIWKCCIYLLLAIGCFIQSTLLIIKPNFDSITFNLSILTMTISLIEFRDNKYTSKKINNEIYNKINFIKPELSTLDSIVISEHINKDK